MSKAEDILKKWMLKNKMIKATDSIRIFKSNWSAKHSVAKNGIIIGKGDFNPRTYTLNNFKFNHFKYTKPKLTLKEQVELIANQIKLPHIDKRYQATIQIPKVGEKFSFMG